MTNYYPFGAPYADADAATGSAIPQYKYNGKELDVTHGLNTYDYGARQLDPILGRWEIWGLQKGKQFMLMNTK